MKPELRPLAQIIDKYYTMNGGETYIDIPGKTAGHFVGFTRSHASDPGFTISSMEDGSLRLYVRIPFQPRETIVVTLADIPNGLERAVEKVSK